MPKGKGHGKGCACNFCKAPAGFPPKKKKGGRR
jgi:hypothetical protein